MLILGIVPGLLYLLGVGIAKALENRAMRDPFERLDRSLTGTMEAKFVVGSKNEPMESSLIANAINVDSPKVVTGTDGVPVSVIRELSQKFNAGLAPYQLVDTKRQMFLERDDISRNKERMDRITIENTLLTHPFVSQNGKEEDEEILNYDFNIQYKYWELMGKQKIHSDPEDYVRGYERLGTKVDQSRINLFKKEVEILFDKIPEDGERRDVEIYKLLSLEHQKELLQQPMQREIVQATLEEFAIWGGMSVDEAFRTSTGNPVSVLQAIIKEYNDPCTQAEYKLMTQEGLKRQEESEVRHLNREDILFRLHMPKGGVSRLSISWKVQLRQRNGKMRTYAILQRYEITPGKGGNPAVVHTIRTGKRVK